MNKIKLKSLFFLKIMYGKNDFAEKFKILLKKSNQINRSENSFIGPSK